MKKYHYFVEGKCEKKLLNVLKEQKNLIISGKVEVLNVIQERLTELKLRPISSGTIIILVFDTDVPKIDILKDNLSILAKCSRFKDVWCVMQIPNLEGEIKKSTNLRDIKGLFDSEDMQSFKKDFICEKNLYKKLCDKGFDISKIWTSSPSKAFEWLKNDGEKIKQKC